MKKEKGHSSMGSRERDSIGLVLRNKDLPLSCPHCRGALAHETPGVWGCTKKGRQTQRELDVGEMGEIESPCDSTSYRRTAICPMASREVES